MRIVAGELKGMTLSADVASVTRPTSDATRESIFNILAVRADLDGMRVADLYAGTGALGLEAFSRGATAVDFVETSKQACATIEHNISTTSARMPHASDNLRVTRTPVLTFAQDQKKFDSYDLVLADPPYDDDIEIEVMNLVASGGYVVYETSAKKKDECEQVLSEHEKTKEVIASKKMGAAGVVIVRAR